MMATIWGILRPILRRHELERYAALADTLLAADIAPASLDRPAALRSVVCSLTGIQPTEFDNLSKIEQLPYLDQAIANLEKRKPLVENILTRTVTKAEAARLHAGRKVQNPTTYFDDLIEKKLISPPIGSGQKWQFILSEFPPSSHERLR